MMNTIFTIDDEDYTDDMILNERFAVRAVIRRAGKYAVQQSSSGDYKLPGGGVETGEDFIVALEREVSEETGLIVIRESIKELGEVIEMRADELREGCKFVQHSYYYQCDVEDEIAQVHMTEEEIARGYRFKWVDLDEIINTNMNICKENWTFRDTRFLQWIRAKMEVFYEYSY